MWFTLVVLAVSTWLLCKCLKRKKCLEPPGPWGLPVVGYLPFINRQKPNVFFAQLAKKYGDVFQLRMGRVKMIIVSGQRVIRQMYGKQLDFVGKPDWITIPIRLQTSYAFTPFSLHFWIDKKLLLRALDRFAAEKAQDLEEAIHKIVSMLVNEAKRRNRQPFDPRDIGEQCAYALSFYHTYGRLLNITSEEIQELMAHTHLAQQTGNAVSRCDYLPWMRWLPTMWKPFREFERAFRSYSDYHLKQATASVDQYINGKTRKCLIDYIYHEATQLDEDDKGVMKVDKNASPKTIACNVKVFSAGVTPLVITTKWLFLFMALYPDVQQKVRKEIYQKISDKRKAGARDAQLLPYTSAVLKEIFRYVTVAALGIVKCTTCDTELDGYFIPKNTAVITNLFTANRDETVFANPDKFDPQRFLTPDGTLSEDAFKDVIDTGLGPRRCSGVDLMWFEMLTFFASLVQTCHIEKAPGFPLDPSDYYFNVGLVPSPYKVVMYEA